MSQNSRNSLASAHSVIPYDNHQPSNNTCNNSEHNKKNMLGTSVSSVVRRETIHIGALQRGIQIGAVIQIGALRVAI